jgi:hypothetical protein
MCRPRLPRQLTSSTAAIWSNNAAICDPVLR